VSDGMASGGRDAGTVTHAPFVMGEKPGAIVAGFDVHRRQITIDALDSATGEVSRGQIASTPAGVEEWVAGFPGRVVHVAVEACTGWLFVCRALERCGSIAHLAEPVETSALRGRKRRAKTDRTDARWLRQLLCEGRLPEAWLPPEHVRQWRSRARLRNTLVAERTSWTQRIRATLYHHGIAGAPDELRTLAGRRFLAGLQLPLDARERITVALEIIDLLDAQLAELERDLRALARRQTGCQALMAQYGMGEISALVTLCELGDVTRLHASRQGRADGRDRHRRAPLRPPRPTRQAHPPRIRPLALGALRGRPIGQPPHQPRLPRLSRAQGARAHPHSRVADHRPQTRPPLLPHPQSARPRRARPS
jgi:transposase